MKKIKHSNNSESSTCKGGCEAKNYGFVKVETIEFKGLKSFKIVYKCTACGK